MTKTTAKNEGLVTELFQAGAHFGFVKARRHPSAKPFIFGAKNNIEIFDLEKTSQELEKACEFMEEKGREGALGIFLGGKSEAREAVTKAANELEMPYVAGRWIGGTLSNFSEIKKRIAKLEDLTTQREKGELAKYTKKERLLIDREIDKLTLYFSGLSRMKAIPKFMVVIDPKKERNAVLEAKRMNLPLVGLAGSDSNLYEVEHAIPGNDASRSSISFVVSKLVEAYKKGKIEGDKKRSEEGK